MKNCRFSFTVFFTLLPKFSDLINSDDCIGKMISKSMRLYSFLLKKRIELNKKGNISSEKIRNSGNYNYDYHHSLFWKDF